MPFDPENTRDVSRLVKSVRQSRKQLGDHLKLRNAFQREYLGAHYSDQGSVKSVAPNLVEQFVSIHKRLLAPTAPSAFVNVRDQSLLGARSKLELGINHLVEEIDLESTLELTTYDALMLMAIVKVGITNETTSYDGYRHDEGQPFVDHILLNDWVHDYKAKSWETVEYAGDRSFEPLELLQETYPEHADALHRAEFTSGGETFDSQQDPVDRRAEGGERVSDYTGVWEFWLPREGLILVMPDSPNQGGVQNVVLEAIEWQGPEFGPYHMLGFEFVPGSTIPLSPIATVFALAKLHGALFRKSSRQAEHQKTVLGAGRGKAADATKLVNAGDMEVVTVDDPNLIKDFKFNGADPQTMQFGALTRDLFSKFAGNLELLGGLSPQSETLGQDRLLAENASERLKTMQKRVKAFTKGILRDLGWWLFTDPRIELPLVKPNPGSSQGIQLTLTAEDMEGDFLDYNIDVNPYSLQARTPDEEFNLLMQLVQGVIMPFSPQLQQQGMTVNFPVLLRRLAELKNMKPIDEFLMFTGSAAPSGERVGSPPEVIKFPSAVSGGQGGPSRNFQQAGGDMAALASMLSGQGAGQQQASGA